MGKIRQPIVTVVGHVDHGKTSLLDSFRESSVQEEEKGGITQKISFTLYPSEQIKKSCPLMEKSEIQLNIPGFLFIDTPGHAAFTNLRKRGGSLSDLAILVIDINEGIKPQTAEVIQILKHNKTPFLIALNKIDNISGWKTNTDKGLKTNIESQSINVKQSFDEKYLTLISSLNHHGFNADLYYNVEDFTKKIALVPCSAKTKEGLPELLMILCGLSQKYLIDKLELGKDAKGIVLEIKKDKGINYIESILYDGELSKNDEIAVSDLEGKATITGIRILEEIEPLSNKFTSRNSVKASTGLKVQFKNKIDVLPGMPFISYRNNEEEIKNDFKKEISETINSSLSKQGIIAKADSLGSLEALLVLLKQSNIPVVKVGIGNINKNDVTSTKANLEMNELDAVIVGFNVSKDEETETDKIKILTDEVIYKLIEELIKFREEKSKEIEKLRTMELTTVCKLKILPQYVFRNTNPAIFGVKVESGKLISGMVLISKDGRKIGRVKNIQSENKSVHEASEAMEVAISVTGTNFERQIKDKEFLYSDITNSQIKTFRKNKDLLSQSEIKTLHEIEGIKNL